MNSKLYNNIKSNNIYNIISCNVKGWHKVYYDEFENLENIKHDFYIGKDIDTKVLCSMDKLECRQNFLNNVFINLLKSPIANPIKLCMYGYNSEVLKLYEYIDDKFDIIDKVIPNCSIEHIISNIYELIVEAHYRYDKFKYASEYDECRKDLYISNEDEISMPKWFKGLDDWNNFWIYTARKTNNKEYLSNLLNSKIVVIDNLDNIFLNATEEQRDKLTAYITQLCKFDRITGYYIILLSDTFSNTFDDIVLSQFTLRFVQTSNKEVRNKLLNYSIKDSGNNLLVKTLVNHNVVYSIDIPTVYNKDIINIKLD